MDEIVTPFPYNGTISMEKKLTKVTIWVDHGNETEGIDTGAREREDRMRRTRLWQGRGDTARAEQQSLCRPIESPPACGRGLPPKEMKTERRSAPFLFLFHWYDLCGEAARIEAGL